MAKTNRLNFKNIILILITFLLCISSYIGKAYGLEDYQLAQVPDNLYLDSYYITAESNEEALTKTKEILALEGLDPENYIITIENNIIKITEEEAGEKKESEVLTETETPTEAPEGNYDIMMTVDVEATIPYKLTTGETIYLPESSKNYKYIFIWIISDSNYSCFAFNEYEITNDTGSSIELKTKDTIKYSYYGPIKTNLYKEGSLVAESVLTTQTNGNYPVNFIKATNFNIDTRYTKNIIEETPEPEEPEEPEIPTNTIDYTEQIKEVNANLEEIKNILISITIICSTILLYSFTRRVLRS